MLVEVIGIKEWMLVEVMGFEERCGYIGRYMDVIDKGFYFYLIIKQTQLLLANENRLAPPPPQSPPRWFPNRKGMFIISPTKKFPVLQFFFSFSTHKRLTLWTQIAIKQNTGCNL
jgi:hypothetical protein